MKQILDDIVHHTHLMGLFPALKIHTNENNETIIESMAEDKSVVLQAITNSPIPDFNYTFGMGSIEKLNTLLKCPEYKDDPIIKVVKSDKDDQQLPIAIEFNNKNNDFKNHYRLMNTEIINEKLKSIRLKQIYWEIDFEPSDTSMQKFKYQVALNNQEKNFSVTTTEGNLIFNFGDQGSHYGSYIFEKNEYEYSVLQKSAAIYWLLENAIDSRRRIKTTTYSDLQQKPCQFYWHGLLQITI
jgi:hypothetical protein